MGGRFGQGFVVHLNGLNLSGQLVRSESDNHTGFDDTRVVENDNLGGKVLSTDSGLVLGVGGDISTLDILDRDVLDVESDIVSGDGELANLLE